MHSLSVSLKLVKCPLIALQLLNSWYIFDVILIFFSDKYNFFPFKCNFITVLISCNCECLTYVRYSLYLCSRLVMVLHQSLCWPVNCYVKQRSLCRPSSTLRQLLLATAKPQTLPARLLTTLQSATPMMKIASDMISSKSPRPHWAARSSHSTKISSQRFVLMQSWDWRDLATSMLSKSSKSRVALCLTPSWIKVGTTKA